MKKYWNKGKSFFSSNFVIRHFQSEPEEDFFTVRKTQHMSSNWFKNDSDFIWIRVYVYVKFQSLKQQISFKLEQHFFLLIFREPAKNELLRNIVYLTIEIRNRAFKQVIEIQFCE